MQVHPFELLSSLSLGHTERVLGFYNLAIKWEDSIILGSSAWTYSQHIWREDFMRICWRNNTTSSTWALSRLSSILLQRQASYLSFNLVVTSINDEIIWASCGLPSRPHDSTSFRINFDFSILGENDFLIGDSGFQGVFSKLITPYRMPTEHQCVFNRMISIQRLTIEHVFGDITNLFQTISSPRRLDYYHLQSHITYACFLLYNFCLKR